MVGYGHPETKESRANERWYTRRRGIVRGPLPARLIGDYLLLGRLEEADEVSRDRESWVSFGEANHLIPEVMRHVVTAEDRDRLLLARRRVDERVADRRTGRAASQPMQEMRRGERRQGEPTELVQHRADRALRRAASLARLESPHYRAGLALVLAFLLSSLGSALWYGWDSTPRGARDCIAPAAPGVDWNHCDRAGAALANADLRGAMLHNARLTRANLRRADLSAADLSNAELSRARLDAAVLVNADLRGSVLRSARLTYANLSGANLSHADLSGASLQGALLDGARLGGAVWTDGRVCAARSLAVCR